jgi:hypothetical protein
LGEHSCEILTEYGLNQAQIDALLADGQADPAELAQFGRLRQAFGVAEKQFEPFFKILSLKNDKSLLGRYSGVREERQPMTPHLALACALLYMLTSDGAIGAASLPEGWLLTSSFVVDQITYNEAAARGLIQAVPGTVTDPGEAIYGWGWAVLAEGANTTAMNKFGDNPLRYAIKNNNTEVSRLLIEKGANVNAKGLYREILCCYWPLRTIMWKLCDYWDRSDIHSDHRH